MRSKQLQPFWINLFFYQMPDLHMGKVFLQEVNTRNLPAQVVITHEPLSGIGLHRIISSTINEA